MRKVAEAEAEAAVDQAAAARVAEQQAAGRHRVHPQAVRKTARRLRHRRRLPGREMARLSTTRCELHRDRPAQIRRTR